MTDTHQSRFGSTYCVALLAMAFASACGGGSSAADTGDTIDRAVFIEAYVDLRVAALQADPQELSDEARAEVLSSHGVTADDLMHFGEVHGRDLEFMRDVWNDVESRMDGLMPEPSG